MPNNKSIFRYTKGEELWNGLTHAVGFFFAALGGVYLMYEAVLTGDAVKIIAGAIYTVSLMLMFAMSATYHLVTAPELKRLFRSFDHLSIYLLIAGTYTPFTLVTLRGNSTGFIIFLSVWGCALLGFGTNFIKSEKTKWVRVILSLAMGWAIVFAIGDIMDMLSAWGILLLLIGGLSYTVGVVFYAFLKMKYMHTVWHVFVIIGAATHYFAVLYYVIL